MIQPNCLSLPVLQACEDLTDPARRWNQARAQVCFAYCGIGDSALKLLFEWLQQRKIQVSVIKMMNNRISNLHPIADYMESLKSIPCNRQLDEDTIGTLGMEEELLRLPGELHLQCNTVDEEQVLSFLGRLMKIYEKPPVRDDMRYTSPGGIRFRAISLPSTRCPVWLRLKDNAIGNPKYVIFTN